MVDGKRVFGKVFLPASPDVKVDAWLAYNSNEIIVEAPISLPRISSWPLMLGEFNGMDKVTFVNCFPGGGVDVGAGGPYKKIRVSYFIGGLHIFDSSDLRFDSATLLSPALADWIIEEQSIDELDKNLYRVPDHEEVVKVVVDEIELTINNSYSIRHSDRELHIKKVCTVLLKAKAKISIEEFAAVWRHLKKLILFLTNKNPEFSKFYVTANGEQYELINVLDPIRDDRFSQPLRISFHHVRGDFSAIMRHWFEKKDLHIVVDLVLEKLINIDMSWAGYFLNVCIALETFHQKFLARTDHSGFNMGLALRNAIASLIKDEELKAWFKEKSGMWGMPSLRERLIDYRNTIEIIMGQTYERRFNMDDLIGKIVKTRNSMAHNGTPANHFSGYELFLVAKTIEYVIRIEILKEVGVNVSAKRLSLLEDARRNVETLAYINQYNQRSTHA